MYVQTKTRQALTKLMLPQKKGGTQEEKHLLSTIDFPFRLFSCFSNSLPFFLVLLYLLYFYIFIIITWALIHRKVYTFTNVTPAPSMPQCHIKFIQHLVSQRFFHIIITSLLLQSRRLLCHLHVTFLCTTTPRGKRLSPLLYYYFTRKNLKKFNVACTLSVYRENIYLRHVCVWKLYL